MRRKKSVLGKKKKGEGGLLTSRVMGSRRKKPGAEKIRAYEEEGKKDVMQ